MSKYTPEISPPAFPQQCADALDVGMVHEGMSLRQWYAGMAMAAVIAMVDDTLKGTDAPFSQALGATADMAFAIADAMIAHEESE